MVDGGVQVGCDAGGSSSQQGLELGEYLLDGDEGGTVGRQEKQACARGLDGLADAIHLVDAQVVQDHGVAGLERWGQGPGHIGAEALAVGCALKHRGGD